MLDNIVNVMNKKNVDFLYNKKRTVLFYLLPLQNSFNNEFDFTQNLVYFLIKIHWRLGKSILITCEDELQANQIDEVLWKIDKDAFLPHDLFKKEIKNNAPIVIFWNESYYRNPVQNLLINLMLECKDFFKNFYEVIDFVPPDKTLKKLARIRYKFYRSIGFNLDVIDSINFINN